MVRVLFAMILIMSLGWACAQEPDEPAATPAPATGSLWTPASTSLFVNTTAHQVGDLLTIIISEDSLSSTSAKHETKKSTEATATPGKGLLSGFKGLGVKGDRGTNGAGSSLKSTRLADQLTVTVTEVLPNGNLRIEGSRIITLEKDTISLVFSGVVRTADVCIDNTIPSVYVAEQRLEMKGAGPIAEKQRPGWFSRLLSVLW